MTEETENEPLLEDQPSEELQSNTGKGLPLATIQSSNGKNSAAQLPKKNKPYIWQFIAGFLGWFLVNTLIYALLNLGNGFRSLGYADTFWFLVLLANLIVLIVLTTQKKTRMTALGITSALALNFVISSLLFSLTDAYAFIPVTYPVYENKPSVSVINPTITANILPIGFHEGYQERVNQSSCTAYGWATDPNDRNIDLTVRVLSDENEVARQVANSYRPYLDASDGCPGGTCAFEFDLWGLISHSQAHTILVQAMDAQTGEWTDLAGSPTKLGCLNTIIGEIPSPTNTPKVSTGLLATPSSVSGTNRVKFMSGGRYLIVEFLDDDLVHFELSAMDSGASVDKPIYTSPMVQKTDYPGPTSLTDDGNGTLETPEIQIRVDQQSLCFTAIDKTKEPDLILTTACPSNLEQAWKWITLTPESFTHAYGLGQQFFTPGTSEGDWIGRIRSSSGEMGNAMTGWNGGAVGNTQFPIVYFAGNNLDSYALFFDNQYKQSWDFSSFPWKAEMGGDWLRFYLLTGPDLPDLRSDYLELTGRPLVPPKKMFGLWVSEFGFDNWNELENKLRTLRANNFPIDGFVLDLQWYGGIRSNSDDSPMGSLTWDTRNFPNPQAKITQYKDKEGIGIILIEESYISKNLDAYKELDSRGYLVRACETCGPVYLDSNPWWGKGGMFDWSNGAAGVFWHDWKREPLLDAGVIGFWTDLGEPETYASQSWYSGISGDYKELNAQQDVHNLYNLFWSQSIYEGYLRNNRIIRPFILSRSGAPGSQRFGVSMWSGDIGSNISSLATHLNAQMHMSLSGMDYYGADIGGFHRQALDGNLNELYTQWFAYGSTFDIPVRVHTENLCNCKETAPDRIGDLKSNLANLRLRYELSPYLYSLSHRAYLYGEALFPPLVYYYQSDPLVREIGNEKLLGRDLLVAIVTAYGATERNVYLPAGDWINYDTNELIHSTGQSFGPFPIYEQGIFKLPMFARSGAIIPQMFVDDQTMNITGKRKDGSVRDELILRVYAGDTESSFTLYEDDGETIAYQNGEVRTTLISQQQIGNTVIVAIGGSLGSYTGAPANRDNVVQLVVEGAENINEVLLNGEKLIRYNTQAEFEAATSGWYYAGDHLILARSGSMNVLIEKIFEFQITD